MDSLACSSCGLCKASEFSIVNDVTDSRLETKSGQFHQRVLFVSKYPSKYDAKVGSILQDSKTDWIHDYLNQCQFEWRLTSVNKCFPGFNEKTNKTNKPKADQVNWCVHQFLSPLIQEFKPDVIVALGGEALAVLWPKKTRGDAPSIAKARLTPIKIGGVWLVTTYDPKMHGDWLHSDGKSGQDLTEEYIRCFEQIHDILGGTFKQAKVNWEMISTVEELGKLAEKIDASGCNRIYLDVEDDSYLGQKIRIHKVDPEGVAPLRLTIYHPDNKLLAVGITTVVEDWATNQLDYATYSMFNPDCWHSELGQQYLRQILAKHRVIECWNTKYDVACLLHFTDIDLRNHQLGDGFMIKGLPDQTKTGNSLKLTAQELLGAPAWDIDLENCKDMLMKQQRAKKLPPLVSMGMMPVEIVGPYNANDTYWNARLVEEKLNKELLNPNFPWIPYKMLLAGLPWLIEMERNGIPADEELFQKAIWEDEEREEKLLEVFKKVPEVVRATAACGKEFNIRSPIFYEALIKELYGVQALEAPTAEEQAIGTMGYKLVIHPPADFPRTDTGRLASDKDTLQNLAGEVLGKVVPWVEKTKAQKLWTKVIEWRQLGDDATRLRGLFDYILDDRIHTNFRSLRSEVPGHEQSTASGSESDGGTVSGRFATSPNVQNTWPRMRMLLRTKPRWLWLKGDYGRIELAWIAWNSQDPLFMQWAREELDQHWARGGALWGRTTGNPATSFAEQDKATQKKWRSKGKTQNFATVYLEEARTTAAKTGATVEEVIQELMLADELHPGIRRLKMEVFETCQAGRKIKTCFGRMRSAEGWRQTSMTAEQWVSPDPLINKGRDHHNMEIYRSLWNTAAAQGDSSDTAFCMGSHIHKRMFSEPGWLHPEKIRSISFEHDCLVYEVREDYLEEAAPRIYDQMRDLSILPIHFGLPLPVDLKYGRIPLEVEPEDSDKYTAAVMQEALKGWKP